jgi:hypothetical protein
MTPTRAGLTLPALALILSGCGAVSAVTLRTTSERVALPDAAHVPPPVITPTPAPTPTPTPAPHAPPPPVTPRFPGALAVTLPASGGQEWLEILAASGAVLGRTEISPPDPWLTRAGADGAYWTQGGAEHELTLSGAVRSLGPVPSDANGVLMGPDGASYAYATSDTAADGVSVNKIVVVHPGRAPQVIADRVSDPSHPTSDAPQSWDYYLISWTAPGITFARVPTGGCGCGSFDMQMQSAFSAVINPATETVTTLTADAACPLSNVGSGLQAVCFASNTTGGTDAIRIVTSGVTHTYPMSGANVAGNAVFSPTAGTVAYETIPISQDTCGATLTPTLHVLTVANGAAVSANVGDFTPAAWAPNGSIYGQLESNDWSHNWVVAVNPATFAVTRLTADVPGVALVGIM